jgi:hypothetical protein
METVTSSRPVPFYHTLKLGTVDFIDLLLVTEIRYLRQQRVTGSFTFDTLIYQLKAGGIQSQV